MKAKLFLALATIFAFAASASADSITIINELPANVTSSIAPTGDYFISTAIGPAGGPLFVPAGIGVFYGGREIRHGSSKECVSPMITHTAKFARQHCGMTAWVDQHRKIHWNFCGCFATNSLDIVK